LKLNNHIKKLLIITLWFVVGAGVMAVLIAAIRIKREKVCKGYVIKINDSTEQPWYIETKDIVRLLTRNSRDTLKGKRTREFDLQKMESRLEKGQWIKDAELFFDNNQVLQVKITERKPIARIITTSGAGFYIDSSCVRLPLPERISGRLPVFTGFPSDKTRLKTADKLLLKEIKKLSTYILSESFWMAQVSQVDITPKRTFEIIPTIGNHIIEFGDAGNYEVKFNRLLIFYKQVISKTGLERYSRINVQYDKQVIAVKNNYISKTDSLKFAKNVELLIASSRMNDTLRTASLEMTKIDGPVIRNQNTDIERKVDSVKLVRQ
jgi:cell division protein FtsQ